MQKFIYKLAVFLRLETPKGGMDESQIEEKHYKENPLKNYACILEQLKKADNVDERELFQMKYL